VIRLATARDVDAAWGIVDSCRIALRERGIAQWDAVYPSLDTVERDVRNGTLFVLMVEDGCAGVVTLDGNADPSYTSLNWETEEPAMIVHRLCVRPDLQGRGIGHRLMKFAEDHATTSAYRSIRLDAYSGNAAAVAFYRQRGYRHVGQLYFPRRSLPFDLFERAVSPGP